MALNGIDSINNTMALDTNNTLINSDAQLTANLNNSLELINYIKTENAKITTELNSETLDNELKAKFDTVVNPIIEEIFSHGKS